jgi:hypothetical protein
VDVAIGLPNALLGVQSPKLVAWAERAEEAWFSVLGTIGRIAHDCHGELIALAAAGATEPIQLITRFGAPPRQAVLGEPSRHAASALGWALPARTGIGGREEDWLALGVKPKSKGQALEECLAT